MPVEFTLTTRIELKQVDQLLGGMSRRAANLSPVFQGPVDSRITHFFEDQFETQGRAGGSPWPAISATTSRLRKRPGHGHEGPKAILRDVNVLWGSYVKSGGPDGIRVIKPLLYIRGSAVPYAYRHQTPRIITQLFGRPLRSPKTIPARQVVPPTLPVALTEGIETDVLSFLESGAA